MTKCKSKIEFGDDFGDNECTFHCQLEKGHTGKHQEKGVATDWQPPRPAYKLTWDQK